MKIGSTIVVVILALAGIAGMVHLQRQDAALAPKAPGARRLLTHSQLPIDQLQRITLTRAQDNVRLVFERRGVEWWQIEPFEYAMDPFSIRQLAVLATELDVIDTVEPGSLERDGLASLKLDSPVAQTVYEWPNGSLALQFGRRGVAGRAYLRIAGQSTVYVVNHPLHERAVEMDHQEWRDRTLFRHVSIESDRIEWEQGASHRVAMQRDRKQWKLVEPVKTRVDDVGRDAYLQDLAAARVAGFILDQPSASELSSFGLDKPVASLTVATAASPGSASTKQRLLIGSRAAGSTQDYYAMLEGRPVVLRLSGSTLGALFRQPQNLVDPTASGVVAADVKSIVIRSASDELKLERELEKWYAPPRDNKEVNAAYVQELLDQLTTLRARAVDFREYPRELEVATITMYAFDGKPMDTVRIAHDATSNQWILENGDNVLRLFPAGLKIRMTASDFGLQ